MSTVSIPQPPERYVIGNMAEIDPNDPLTSIGRLHALYGDIFRLKVPFSSLVVISSQELVHFASTDPRFDKKIGRPLMEVRNVAGDGLFTAHTDEPNWQLAHKLLIPAFGPVSIRDMYPVMTDIAEQMLLRWERFEGEVIDVCEDYTRLTLDAIALASFNYRFNSFYSREMHPFVEAMTNVLKGSQVRARMPGMINNVLDKVMNKSYWQDIKLIHDLADDIIKERRTNPRPEVDDLLNRMINGKDHETGYQLSDENIRFQLATFLIAGHETTSGLLSFATYYLLKNPACLMKARKEADAADLSKVENISKLVYIEAVLKETLRLRSSAPAFFFGIKEDYVILPGGYKVTKDDAIVVFLNGLHRDPAVWQRPEEFNPDRMMPEEFAKLPEHSWKPFGNGQRSCIGRGFAMQEATMTLAMVLRKFDLELVDPTYELKIKTTLTIKPEGLQMRARKRQVQQAKAAADASTQKEIHATANPGERLTVLYGSNSGSCESFANSIASEAGRYGLRAVVSTLDSKAGALPTDHPVVIVTASYEGKPCDNAKLFVAHLEDGSSSLKDLKYSVFGCGHHDWRSTYQRIPTYIDTRLEELGATRLVKLGAGDAAGDFFGAFEEWKTVLFKALLTSAGKSSDLSQPSMSVEIVPSTRNIAHIAEVGRIVANTEIVAASELGPAKRHIEIDLPAGQTYRTGDYLAISPFNPDSQVQRVLKQFQVARDDQVIIKGGEIADTSLPVGQPITFQNLIRGHLDLASPATKATLNAILTTSNDQDKVKLQHLIDNYESVIEKRISVLDALQLHPSSKFTIEQFLSAVPALRIRQYSISSSPLWRSERCTISIDILRAPAFSGLDEHRGVASNYLAELKEGDEIACSVRISSTFRLPDKIDTPIVMFAAGSGIAPFRGFMQERAQQVAIGRQVGRMVLFYGCRTEQDFMYKTEIEEHVKAGILELYVAYSRGEKKVYVPDLVYEQKALLRELFHGGASFYTCGSATRLASSLKKMFIKIVSEFGEMTEDGAVDKLREMTADRYAVDVFA